MRRAALVVTLASAAALACASTGGPKRVDASVEAVPQPEAGPRVRIARVVDVRTFYRKPVDHWKPSVSKADPDDREVTRRVLARHRARGRGADVEAAKGETVESLVAGALTRAFRLAGFRVIDDDRVDGSPEAAPVEAEIETLWARPFPPSRVGGIWRFRCRLGIRVQAPLAGLAAGRLLEVEHLVARSGPNSVAFGPLVRGCLERFADRLHGRLARWADAAGVPVAPPRSEP